MPKRTLDELTKALQDMGAMIENTEGELSVVFSDHSDISIAIRQRDTTRQRNIGLLFLQKGSTVIYPPQYGYKITAYLGNGALILSPE